MSEYLRDSLSDEESPFTADLLCVTIHTHSSGMVHSAELKDMSTSAWVRRKEDDGAGEVRSSLFGGQA